MTLVRATLGGMIAATVFLYAASAFAAHNASVLRINPATDGGKYINVQESNTLKQWKFNVGAVFNYAFEPLEFASTEGSRRRGIVDDLVMADVQAAVAFTDWFLVGANFPIALFETFTDPNVPADQATKESIKLKPGDLRVDMKFRLLNIERFHVGLSVIPFLFIPTGNSKYFLGTGMWSPGATIAFDADIKNRVFLSFNAGYRHYSKTFYFNDPTLNPNAWIDDTLILNGGVNVRITDSLAILGEFLSEGVIQNFWQNQQQTPAEFLVGGRYTWQRYVPGLSMTVTGGKSITRGIGSPDFRALVALNYRYGLKRPPPPPTPVSCVVEEKIVITQSIHFEFDRAVIRPVSYPILNDVVALLLQNPQISLVRVEGHTDWIGSDEYNLKLSQRRADAVRDYLVSNGVAPNRLVAVGYGESRPIADNNTVVGRARNRRTEFTVLETGGRAAGSAGVSSVGGASFSYGPAPSRSPATVSPQTTSTKYGVTAPARPQAAPQPVPQPYAPPQRAAAAPAAPQAQAAPLAPSGSYSQMKGIIYFPTKENALTPEAEARLREIANLIKKDKSVIGVRFEAFAGAEGGEMGDNDLAWKRAATAQNYFVSAAQGIGRNVEVSNFGFGEFTYGEGEKANRGKVLVWIIRRLEK